MYFTGYGTKYVVSLTAHIYDTEMKQLVRDNPTVKLREINAGKLKNMGIPDNLAEAFLNNLSFDPYEETLLVGQLDTMSKVKGRDVFIARAGRAKTAHEAMLLRHQAEMMAGYHANVAKVASIANIAGVTTLKKTDGGLAVVLPADLMFLTENLNDRVGAFEQQVGQGAAKELLVSGRFDTAAQELLMSKGWKTVEKVDRVLSKAK